ncbi:uncharacterized protein LOC100256944 isoform X2 [Vitis vinifera]|uniref:uncharacterized protein LOC100256944 isoform X2 n=1 Tax=Vitis vinifera TaxID=29760 RepID=UPI00054018C1|nr:uncharacterized protein LOC100256944 isoform X2 [Vitis vinifera]|eukprot:XP_010663192.1 PREDICTED: uncharacterized protein LOC100256944 isoform X2 [Vitis vinifera]
MPGPGPHMMYALGSSLGLMSTSNGRFSPHHSLAYAINAFFGPDLGSFSEWLTSTLGFGHSFGSALADVIHDPFFYIVILGLPLSFLYSWLSRVLLQRGFLDSVSGENGHSSMYTWILSTGWWKNRAPVNPDAVVVVGFLCASLIGGFMYINRLKPSKSIKKQTSQSVKLIVIIATLYCLWCASQIYWVNPRRAAVGEEADLGVLVFLAIYFFLPHTFCIMSMNPKDHFDMEQLPI